MGQVLVTIAGRAYRLACDDGEEERLAELGRTLDERVATLRGALGELGDMRLVVMAGITLVDEVQELGRELAEMRGELNGAKSSGRSEVAQAAAAQDSAAALIAQVAERLEGLARELGEEARRP